jgi:hypothetical protein
VFNKSVSYSGKCGNAHRTKCNRLRALVERVLYKNQADARTIARINTIVQGARLLPGGEPAYQLSEGNLKRAGLAFAIDVVGMGSGIEAGGGVVGATGNKAAGLVTGTVVHGGIRAIGHGTTRAVAGD